MMLPQKLYSNLKINTFLVHNLLCVDLSTDKSIYSSTKIIKGHILNKNVPMPATNIKQTQCKYSPSDVSKWNNASGVGRQACLSDDTSIITSV